MALRIVNVEVVSSVTMDVLSLGRVMYIVVSRSISLYSVLTIVVVSLCAGGRTFGLHEETSSSAMAMSNIASSNNSALMDLLILPIECVVSVACRLIGQM